MGATQSNISSNVDMSYIDSNVDGVNTFNKNGIEIIDIDLPDFENTESESDTINNVFEKLEKITNPKNNVNNSNEQIVSAESSPFISTEMYNKIMNVQTNADSNSSPFVNTEKFNEIMKGGFEDDSSSSESNDSDDSTSDSEFLRSLSDIYISSEMMSKSKHDHKEKHHKEKHHKEKHHKKKSISSTSSHMSDVKKTYGFSETSSEVIKTSENNYYINNATTSDTPYKVESSEINTSDINLVSVDSRNGRRFI